MRKGEIILGGIILDDGNKVKGMKEFLLLVLTLCWV